MAKVIVSTTCHYKLNGKTVPPTPDRFALRAARRYWLPACSQCSSLLMVNGSWCSFFRWCFCSFCAVVVGGGGRGEGGGGSANFAILFSLFLTSSDCDGFFRFSFACEALFVLLLLPLHLSLIVRRRMHLNAQRIRIRASLFGITLSGKIK